MKELKNICNWYIGAWCLYKCQGILYAQGGFISKTLLMLLLAVSMYYFVYVNLKYKLPRLMIALNLLIAMFTIYGIAAYLTDGRQIIGIEGASDTFMYLKVAYSSLLPVYAFYAFAKKGLLTEKTVRCWLPFFILSALALYESNHRYQMMILESYNSRFEEVTNNAGYSFLAIIPALICCDRKGLLQYGYLLVCIAMVFFAMKRGAIMITSIVVALLLFRNIKHSSGKAKWWYVIGVLILCVIMYKVIGYMLSNSDYFIQRIEDTRNGDTSGRNEIYGPLWRHFIDNISVIPVLFGEGAWATTKITFTAAHNDWLEILIDQGVLGIIIFLTYNISFVRSIRRMNCDRAKFAMLLTFIIVFMRTFFSMSVADTPMYATCIMGLCLGNGFDDISVETKEKQDDNTNSRRLLRKISCRRPITT